jgi:hypothetical protein
MLDKIVGPFYTPFKGSSSALLAFRKEVSMGPKEIVRDVYLVGGSDITDPKDCSIYSHIVILIIRVVLMNSESASGPALLSIASMPPLLKTVTRC